MRREKNDIIMNISIGNLYIKSTVAGCLDLFNCCYYDIVFFCLLCFVSVVCLLSNDHVNFTGMLQLKSHIVCCSVHWMKENQNDNENKKTVECNGNNWIENGSVYIWLYPCMSGACISCACLWSCALIYHCSWDGIDQGTPSFSKTTDDAIEKESKNCTILCYDENDWHIAWLVILVPCDVYFHNKRLWIYRFASSNTATAAATAAAFSQSPAKWNEVKEIVKAR